MAMGERNKGIRNEGQQVAVAKLTWTLVLVSIGAVFIWGVGLLLIVLGEQVLETVGVIPRLWAATHMGSVLAVSTLFSLPIIGFMIIVLFRKAIEKEENEADVEETRPRTAAGPARPRPPHRDHGSRR